MVAGFVSLARINFNKVAFGLGQLPFFVVQMTVNFQVSRNLNRLKFFANRIRFKQLNVLRKTTERQQAQYQRRGIIHG